MKRLLTAGLVASALFSGMASAGTSYIPSFVTSSSGTWCALISNVSNVNVDVTIKVFNAQGTLYTGPTYNDVSKYAIAGKLNTPFTLAPNQTGNICTNQVPDDSTRGYGVVQGVPSNPNDAANAYLIGRVFYTSAAGGYSQTYTINGGNPF